MANLNYEVNRLPKNTTLVVNVRTTKQFKMRLWIAMHLIRLASLVMGCGIRFEEYGE